MTHLLMNGSKIIALFDSVRKIFAFDQFICTNFIYFWKMWWHNIFLLKIVEKTEFFRKKLVLFLNKILLNFLELLIPLKRQWNATITYESNKNWRFDLNKIRLVLCDYCWYFGCDTSSMRFATKMLLASIESIFLFARRIGTELYHKHKWRMR